MNKTLIKLYVEMPDGMTVEHYTDKAPVELADAMQRMLMGWSQHQTLPAQTGAHQRAETVQNWWEGLMSVLQREEVSGGFVFFADWQEH